MSLNSISVILWLVNTFNRGKPTATLIIDVFLTTLHGALQRPRWLCPSCLLENRNTGLRTCHSWILYLIWDSYVITLICRSLVPFKQGVDRTVMQCWHFARSRNLAHLLKRVGCWKIVSEIMNKAVCSIVRVSSNHGAFSFVPEYCVDWLKVHLSQKYHIMY